MEDSAPVDAEVALTADEARNRISYLIDDVTHASRLNARQRGTSIRPTVDSLAALCYEHGLEVDQLAKIVDLVTLKNHLDQASLAVLAKNMYPKTTLPDEVVIKTVAALGHGELKPTFPVQALLIRWLIIAHHVIARPEVLGRAYAVLFNLLDTAAIRPQLCHLLALITRRKHVRPFRIQYLMDLSLRLGSDPAVIGLLRVYKDYYPEIIVGDAIKGRASAFKHPDIEWRMRLDEIQDAHSRSSQARLESQANSGFRSRRAIGSRPQRGGIPAAHTSQATEKSVTLEEIDSAARFVQILEKIEFPDQLVAVVSDPLLQKLMQLRPDQTSFRRVSNWIGSMIQDIEDYPNDISIVTDMMSVLYDYVSKTKHIPPVILSFFEPFVPSLWNGRDSQEEILAILSFIPIKNWTDLYTSLFQNIEAKVIQQDDPQSQITLLNFYTILLRNWISLFLAADTLDADSSASISELISHGNTLCSLLAQTLPSTASHLVILDFLEQAAVCHWMDGLKDNIRALLPDGSLVYGLMLSQSPAVLSRLCLALSLHKKSMEQVVQLRTPQNTLMYSGSYDKLYVGLFNAFLMDTVNCLWRLRAFSLADPNSRGCMIPQPLVESLDTYIHRLDGSLSISMAFGLSFSPALSGTSIEAFWEAEDRELQAQGRRGAKRHAGPVTANSLARLQNQGGIEMSFQEYRVKVLRYLDSQGLSGIPELMRSTMKILMTPRKT
ncbi:hypothetical protein TD95_003234 [Thielaviopsis punctulata]|uniref:Mis6 domain protein n=1 Tax=Thielaviopsis punctulata TaxID=72032 RepID=A0A0F4ZCI3_9PEZI|nr:hypothetical protein TD95_003234 [Thielaviopsis punctulata]